MPATTHLIGAFGLQCARNEVDWHPGPEGSIDDLVVGR